MEDAGGAQGGAEFVAELDLAGWVALAQNTSAGAVTFDRAGSHSVPRVTADRYSRRMLSFIVPSTCRTISSTGSAGASKPFTRSFAKDSGSSSAMNRSPATRSCQVSASGCQV